jgi:DNA-binding NarL/FixJ family response regulator
MVKQDILVGLVEDQLLFRKALIPLINQFENCRVMLEAGNGLELQEELKKGSLPDIVLLDIQMPGMNGYDTLAWLQKNYPSINVIIVTFIDSDFAMMRLLRDGAKAFLKKNMHPDELKKAIYSVKEKGYYYSDHTARRIFNALHDEGDTNEFRKYALAKKEIQFLQFARTDLTYKEIAREMKLSIRAIDKMRDHLFFKLDVKNRVSLVVKSLHEGIVA